MRHSTRHHLVLGVLALAALAPPAIPWALAAADQATTTLDIMEPYARAVPPGQPNSAVFMTIANHSDQDQALIAAESESAMTVELHTHLEEDGMMRMRQIERIDIPAGERVVLQPGGLHLMLIGLKQPLEVGGIVDLTLVFEDGERLQIQAPVQQLDMHHRHH
ncbi:hypothetical protein CKO25_01425 [Thiocapsa imhoffii]|uniref:Copper chaperone PCu(A)C n=1 Tax=Thiocapsa imhoffii TaxID=382777 RepID=A0A9X0WEZ8_9GAMM|nr:copper chaperone PCu(A)C [Thiocapsa imhoffii]MBK1643335.1 hypothetical protein [Thiocapsa imhoffii]